MMGRWARWLRGRERFRQLYFSAGRFGGSVSYESGVDGGPGGASVEIDDASIPEDATVGTLVGTLSVTGGTGTYAFTLTGTAGGLFALDGVDDTLLEVAGALDFETATSHQITVEADNGVDPVIQRIITITVTDVAEAAGDDAALTGYFEWA